MVRCSSVWAAGDGRGFFGWGVFGRLTVAFILFVFVAELVASTAR